MKFASPHLRSKYFTAELFHLAKTNFTRRRRISLKKTLAFASAFFWLPELISNRWLMHTAIGGIGRSEKITLAISTAGAISTHSIPSRPFTVSLRSKLWVLSWCHCCSSPFALYIYKKAPTIVSALFCGSPNWESKIKITECCFYRSDVPRCEKNEPNVLRRRSSTQKWTGCEAGTCDSLRSKRHLVRAGWGEKKKSSSFLNCFMAPRTGLEPVTSWLTVMRSTDWAIEE